MQLYFKLLIKDLVSDLLNINIPVQKNMSKKKQIDFTVSTIDYNQPIQLFTIIELIIFQLDRLSLLIHLFTNPNYINSESHSDNYNIDKKSNEVFLTEEMPPTDLNCSKSENHINICRKYHYT